MLHVTRLRLGVDEDGRGERREARHGNAWRPTAYAGPEAGLPEAGLPEAGLPEAGLPEAAAIRG
ncbi:MAG: hypothetical protein AAGJ11_03770 [Bacteroidota bacterium]